MGSEAAAQGELGLLLMGVLGDRCVTALVERGSLLPEGGGGFVLVRNLEG